MERIGMDAYNINRYSVGIQEIVCNSILKCGHIRLVKGLTFKKVWKIQNDIVTSLSVGELPAGRCRSLPQYLGAYPSPFGFHTEDLEFFSLINTFSVRPKSGPESQDPTDSNPTERPAAECLGFCPASRVLSDDKKDIIRVMDITQDDSFDLKKKSRFFLDCWLS